MTTPMGNGARAKAASGKSLRERVPRSSHATWSPHPHRLDPVRIVEAANAERLASLVPMRHARMVDSPFAFFRGSAAIMAADLARTPVTGLTVQACGDAHLLNFGGFATPERNVIFDVTDFDETLPGPWEWDIKRLATSIVLGGRHNGLRAKEIRVAALAAVRSYRTRMRQLAALPALDVWYARLDACSILNAARDPNVRRRRDRIAEQAATQSIHDTVEKLTELVNGERRFREDPPLLYHSTATDRDGFDITEIFATYAWNLAPDVRVLFERYRLIDAAIKVVGVGSVGTRCAIALLAADDGDPLLLQVKEALPSVLAPFVRACGYANDGERVVRGQRIMQAASDVFLGWASSGDRSFFVRQFKDMKSAADLEVMDGANLREYAHYCAWALAGAHARSGDAAAIGGYLGKSTVFDEAVVAFALAYGDCAERDYERFAHAVEVGRIEAA